MTSHDNYVHFDELEGLPKPNRENYIFELDYFSQLLPNNSSVLQVGSMDGARILRFLDKRPDLKFTGLEIEDALVRKARHNTQNANHKVPFITADITSPPKNIGRFDFVLCLNNTLGFIPDYETALRQMRDLGTSFVSVYGEAFDDSLAEAYYQSVGITIEEISNNEINLQGIGVVRRFTKSQVESWGEEVVNSPIGYIVKIN